MALLLEASDPWVGLQGHPEDKPKCGYDIKAMLGPPVERLESGYPFLSVVYFSSGTLPN